MSTIHLAHEFEQTKEGEIFGIRFSSKDAPGHEVIWNRKKFNITHLAMGDHPLWPEAFEHAPAFTYAQARQAARKILEDSAKGIDESNR
jgi:hypothetical protein